MKFLKRKYAEFKEDKAKEKAIDKKIKQVQEGQKIAAEKKNLINMGLSDDEAEFKARKNLKKANRKEKIDSLASGVGNVVDALSMEMGVDPDIPPKKKSSSSKKKGNSKKKKGKGGGGNPLNMDLPGFRI
jgi:hypothetical protein